MPEATMPEALRAGDILPSLGHCLQGLFPLSVVSVMTEGPI